MPDANAKNKCSAQILDAIAHQRSAQVLDSECSGEWSQTKNGCRGEAWTAIASYIAETAIA